MKIPGKTQTVHTTTHVEHHTHKVQHNPSHLHAGMQKMTGGIQAAVGRMTHNPNTIIKGEEKKVAAQAEADLARLRNAHKAATFSHATANNVAKKR